MDDIPDELMDLLQNAHRYEKYIYSLCPFHDDSRPSFFVYADTYKCAACGRWGKTEELAQKLDNLRVYPHQKQSYSYNPFSKWLKDHSLSEIMHIANKNLPIHYLKNRGISPNIQNELHLGLLDDWITFPILNSDGWVIGAVARAGEENNAKSKYILPYKQDPNMLYIPSWNRIAKRERIYLTFGILDAVTLYAAGFSAASTTTGKRINPSAFDDIRKKVVIIPDNGEQKEALKLASKLGWRGKVLQLQWADGCKDVNDLVWKAKIDLDQLKEMINAMG